jgi:hypothetical protein
VQQAHQRVGARERVLDILDNTVAQALDGHRVADVFLDDVF